MKYSFLNPRRLAIDCAVILLLHAVLREVMTRTRIMEKMMAMQFNIWELALIVSFVVTRLMVFFLVPATLAALLVWAIFQRVDSRARP